MKRSFRRKRPGKKQARTKKKRNEKERSESIKTFHHKQYGQIPLLKKSITGRDGKQYIYYDYDPAYAPALPRGAVRGDISQQVFCSMCHIPKYFYVDEKRHCLQCRKEFVFSAREQRFWYEHLKFNFHTQAVRCVSCRKQRRSERAVQGELMMASEKAKTTPQDPLVLLALAEALAKHFKMFGKGNLNKAISCCRKAYRLSPRLHECLFWEAICHSYCGRQEKASALFSNFITEASGVKRCSALVRRAREEV